MQALAALSGGLQIPSDFSTWPTRLGLIYKTSFALQGRTSLSGPLAVFFLSLYDTRGASGRPKVAHAPSGDEKF